MFVRNKESGHDSVAQLQPSHSLSAQVRRVLRYAYIRSELLPFFLSNTENTPPFSVDRSRFAREVIQQLPPSDVYHLHWIAGFIDLPIFFDMTEGPVVWTLHDMNPFTGGCHYSLGCERYTQNCGDCPQLGSSTESDPSRRIWKRKEDTFQEAIRADRLHIVSPSHWLADQASRSSLLGNAPITCIPHGLDHSLFSPKDSSRKRRRLSISREETVLLFVASSTSNKRKGFSLLSEALGGMDPDDAVLLSVGRGKPHVPSHLRHVHAGHVDDDKKLAAIYSLADIFVMPSLQEAFGQTVLESMACGTPVVAFDTGGIPDMVRPGETGWLAEKGDVYSLRHTIETTLEDDSERERRGRRCREVVEEEYTLEQQARRYATLYNSIQ